MQAGEVFIDITARLDKLDAGLNEAARMAVSAIEKAKEEFKAGFSDAMEEAAAEGSDSFKEVLEEDFTEKTSEEAKKAGESAGKEFSKGFEAETALLTPGTVAKVEAQSSQSGNAFAKTFLGRIKRSWTESGGAEQLAAGFAKKFGPMAAAGAADGMADFLRSDKSMGDAAIDALKSIPWAGSFVNLGMAITETIMDAEAKAQEKIEERNAASRAALLRVAGEKQSEANQAAKRTAELMHEREKLDLEQQVADIRAEGDDRATTLAEYQAKAEQMRRDLALALSQDVSDQEKKLMQENHDRRIQLMENELDLRLKQIDEQKQAEQEAQRIKDEQLQKAITQSAEQADLAADLAEMELEFQQKIQGADEDAVRRETAARDARLRQMERERALAAAKSDEERDSINRRFDAEQAIADLASKEKKEKQDMKLAEQQAAYSGISAQTALGSFTFDPYPAAKMREVQERTMKATEEIAKEAKNAGGFV